MDRKYIDGLDKRPLVQSSIFYMELRESTERQRISYLSVSSLTVHSGVRLLHSLLLSMLL